MNTFIDGTPGGVVLLKYPHGAIAHASYLLIDQRTGVAAVVDPYGDVDVYLEDAWKLGATIQYVFLTRIHDYPSSHLELSEKAGANVYAGAWARPHPGTLPVKEGDVLEFGRVRLRIMETPGHRLEALVLLIYDPAESRPQPYAAFTGKTVLLGDVGRPSPAPGDGFGVKELAEMLHDSLTRKILALPPEARLLPAHPESSMPDTVAAQKDLNPGFQPMSKKSFVRRLTLDMGEIEDLPAASPRPSSLAEILRGRREGALLVDERDPVDFAAGHMAGSVNLPSAARFEPWAERLIEKGRPVLLLSRPGREGAMAARLSRAGIPVAGFLEGGLAAAGGTRLRRERALPLEALRSRMDQGASLLLLDGRAWDRAPEGPPLRGYPVPLERLREELPCFPRASEVVVCDDSPYRASAAASVLRAEGFPSVSEVAGGLALWGGRPPLNPGWLPERSAGNGS